ncbi:hypothetical protein MADA3029_30038 [Vibrio nigripulchritudo MADA3029]|uniref:Transposase n=1 Tax=Vibrio nigripulchritudo SOn1 TaxID=1238450 RepID=A0AAV2VRD2_9VIBR|nr:hypothetical protein [Vibrio nigripulchritudo]EGU60479.1 hypothetical protein VINI7043_02340 [Vibrio nigripulchritudo ATCC 27043]CCN49413.1 hypothetical protein VIBNIMADA3020_740015 [Vibrio nigripulchritudo MADA3020]CCN53789.1 hypothetical protein VIBNIMADA3021_400038 [Vibrio nigripulchritudo MADA3021]CCN58921.1 hypothetical protein MADA3029_30038 [Vibrio nigripulchritudo MADA3029]CCO47214.1 hypothetical protein VIBNISOn1_270040 [Vibrio nigripulchritudo SOn1]
MLASLKALFASRKDHSGRNINTVIARLAIQTGSNVHAWSYIEQDAVYENTFNGQKIYSHELARYAL